jgi:succinoglycan biosynthesis transport protein ExoP
MIDDPLDSAPPFSVRWSGFVNKLYRYRQLLKKRWWVPLLTLSIGLGIAAWWASTLPPVFLSTARMMVSGKVSIPEGGAAYSEELSNFFGTQIELMRSGEVRRRAQEQVLSRHPEIDPAPVTLEVAQLRGAAIFTLKATGRNPEFSQLFLDACMDEYIESKKEMRSTKSETTVSAITEELSRLEKELRQGEEELLAFQRANNVGYLEEEGNSAGTYLANLNRQLADLRKESELLTMLDLDQNLDRVQKQASEGPGNSTGANDSVLSGFGPEAEYLKAKQQVEMLKAQRDDFGKVLRPAHPTMVQLEDDISKFEKLISTFRNQSVEQLKTRRESMALQIQSLEKVAREWEAKAMDLSQRLAEYNRIKSKLDRAKAVYDRLLTSLRSVDVTKRIDQDSVSILERASTPISVRPGLIKTAMIGLGAGALVGLLILFLLDRIDDRMTSFDELQSTFSERVLSQVPQEKHQGDLTPLVDHDPRHAFAESFRSLRSSIFYLPVEGAAPKTILVTSSVPNEGKSTVSTNLAVTLALANSKVLLIDTDVRRGTLHNVFGLKNERGLGEVLRGEGTGADCVQSTSVPNLSLLSRGGSLDHPSEQFLGPSMDQLLRDVYDAFDYIILDSAPVMVADDTASLAPKIDACIYVVRFSFSSARVSRKALDLLKSRQANVIGLVCNDVHASMPEYYYYYQYSEYYGAKAKSGA